MSIKENIEAIRAELEAELEKAENAPARERLSRMFDLNSNTVS